MSEGRLERIRLDVRLAASDATGVRRELRAALDDRPRRIPTKYFYDDVGSHLFEQICELPEYYQTRTEAQLLRDVAARLVEASGDRELVELGSGASTKTRILLDAMQQAGQLETYVPVDVSEGIVRRVAEELIDEYPELEVHGLIADFMQDLGHLPAGHDRLVIFLGGTIGNFEPNRDAVAFLRTLRQEMTLGDHLLLGTDLIKDVAIVEAAYNDSQGITAAFNKNALVALNRDFGADFDLDAFTHRAFYDRANNWIEMRLVSTREQTVTVPGADLVFTLDEGEELVTEISTKFDRARVERLYEASGFELVEWYTDADQLFGLSLARVVD